MCCDRTARRCPHLRRAREVRPRPKSFFPRASGDLELAASDRPGLRVLFVGNSYTYYNSMPSTVRELAEGAPGSAPVYTVEYTAPNWSLRGASENDGLADALEDFAWDFVVLQDVSWHLSLSPEARRRMTYPFAGSSTG